MTPIIDTFKVPRRQHTLVQKDVTNLGRWGNGDVEVGLSTLDELPYVMGLVRQSFEKQMGNGGGNM